MSQLNVKFEDITALAEQVNVVMNTLLGPEDEANDRQIPSHSLRRLIVLLADGGADWILTEKCPEAMTNEGKWRRRCLQLAVNSGRPCYDRPKPPLLADAIWAPLRRLNNVSEVQLLGLIGPGMAEELSKSMSSPKAGSVGLKESVDIPFSG
jgi:hypothetical protein